MRLPSPLGPTLLRRDGRFPCPSGTANRWQVRATCHSRKQMTKGGPGPCGVASGNGTWRGSWC